MRLLLIGLLGLAITHPLSAQATFADRDKIAAQKLAAEVESDKELARKIMRTDPAQAITLLRGTLAKIQASPSLPGSIRTRLTSEVNGLLRQADEALRILGVQQELSKINKPTTPTTPPATGKSPVTEPGAKGVFDTIKNAQGSTKVTLDDRQRQKIDAALRGNEVFNSIRESSTPIAGNIEYSKAWEQITAMRKPKMDPKEQEILKALNSVLSTDYKDNTVNEILGVLQEKTGLNIFVQASSLKELMLDLDEERVTLKVNKATVRTILRKILGDRGLTYIIEEGSLQVMSIEKAKQKVVARVYNVSDLVNLNIDPRIAQFDPLYAQAMRFQNGQYIANMIMQTVDPGHWAPAGGTGHDRVRSDHRFAGGAGQCGDAPHGRWQRHVRPTLTGGSTTMGSFS